ncbi:MAG: hypothetical protein LBS27_10290 [Bifidobacteriaceae bacterium]|jgi:hypothetical protein|nr:hypothetical protein [Bifidobacteriaceae bacterium]
MRRRTSRRAVLGGVALVVLGACAGAAGVLATRWPAPDLTPLEQATASVMVFAEISEQPLSRPVSIIGIVHPPQTKDVFAPGSAAAPTEAEAVSTVFKAIGSAPLAKDLGPGTEGAEPNTSLPATPNGGAGRPAELETLRLVVTVQKKVVGDLIGPGEVVAEVSGRPVFAIPPGMPFYRNMAVGVKGADVTAFQEFLKQAGHFGGQVGNEFNSATLTGLRALYQAVGYDPPLADGANPGFVLNEFVEVAAGAVPVVEAAAAGTSLETGTPLVRVVTGQPWVSGRVSLLDVEALGEGAEVTVTAAEVEPLAATVGTVGEYQTDGTAGYDLTIPLTVEWFDAAGDVQQVTVSPVGETPVGPAAPLTAIREDAKGVYLLAAVEAGAGRDGATPSAGAGAGQDQAVERVAITITGQVGGYALIAADEALPIGRRIVVSGDGGAAG